MPCPHCTQRIQIPMPPVPEPQKATQKTVLANLEEPLVELSPVQPPPFEQPPPHQERVRDYDDDDERPRRYAGRFRCVYCGTNSPPYFEKRISPSGWVVFVVLLLFCFPLFFIGLLIQEDYRVCSRCGIKIGG